MNADPIAGGLLTAGDSPTVCTESSFWPMRSRLRVRTPTSGFSLAVTTVSHLP